MATLINGTDCLDAWRNVCSHLIAQPTGDDVNVIVEIDNPCDFTDLDTWLSDYNPKDFHASGDNLRHVINTIFPYTLKSFYPNRQNFYTKYASIYTKSRNKKWGTYFQRLISFGKGFTAGNPNQLEKAIVSLQGNSPQRFFITFHITASNVESNTRPLGGPCWQFGEVIKNPQGGIDLVAVYRNHDYFNKALGNYIGLAKLLEFICAEANQTPGRIIIHSIHGYSSEGIPLLTRLKN